MNIFLFNSIIYIIIWVFFYYKIRRLNLFMIVWSGFTVTSIMGYIALETGFYLEASKEQVLKNASWEPLLFSLICYLIVIAPFWKVDERKIDLRGVNIKNTIYRIFVKFNIIIYSIISIFKIYEMIVMQAFISYAEQYEISKGGEGLSLGSLLYTNSILEHISALGGTYCNTMSPLMMLFFLAKISQSRKLGFGTSISIFVTLIPVVAVGVVGASRGAIFFAMFQITFYYFLVKQYLNKKTKKSIISLAIIVFSLFLGVSVAITESREESGAQNSTVSSIVNYFGQPILNANYVYYGKVKQHPMGARFIDMRSRDENKNLPYQVYWSWTTGVSTHYFKSLYGDIYIEFGTFIGIVFLLIYSWLWNFIILRNYYKPVFFPFLWFYFYMLIYANFDFEKFSFINNVWFPFLILFCVILSKILKKNTVSYHPLLYGKET